MSWITELIEPLDFQQMKLINWFLSVPQSDQQYVEFNGFRLEWAKKLDDELVLFIYSPRASRPQHVLAMPKVNVLHQEISLQLSRISSNPPKQ